MYIDPRAKPLAHLDRLVAWQRGEKPAPVTIEWDLSNRCPLGCVFCAYAHTHTKGPLTLTDRRLPMAHDKAGDLADTELTLKALADAAEFGVQGIVWAGGGEPLTHPAWRIIIEHAHTLGLQQGMYTSAGLLNEGAGAFLRERLSWAVVSLDAVTAVDYARLKRVPESRFEAACNGLRYLTGGAAKVGASFLLHAGNWEDVWDMLALGRELGAHYVTFRPVVETSPNNPSMPLGDRSWVTAALPILETLAVEASDVEVDPQRFIEWRDWESHPYPVCYGIRLNTTITPDGRVWVCPNRREFAGASCLGDLRTESFADIWARHPGQWTDFKDCRAMCRLHAVNQTLAAVEAPREHGAFI